MLDQLPPDLDQAPPDALDGLRAPVSRHGKEALGKEQVVGHDPDGEVEGIGPKVTTGQPVHANAPFQLLELQPVPDGRGGGDALQVEGRCQCLVVSDLPDILNGLAPTVEGQGEGRHIPTGRQPSAGAGLWQVLIDQRLDFQGVKELAYKVSPLLAVMRSSVLSNLNGRMVCRTMRLPPLLVDWFHRPGEDYPSPKPFTIEGFSRF